jgi:2-polyprenyl-3-methyl-5-hydroxy-6-metoxy-1,4-benzoquinol methylase
VADSHRTAHELAHSRMLAQTETEEIWGWGTPAGQLRAKRRAELICAGARLGPGVKALEIGCGTGMFTEMFAATGARLVGVDLSPELLEKARARHLPPNQVQFLEKPFEDCLVDGPFDAIIGSSILHHLDVEAALPKIFSLLKPGGRISFAEPNLLNPQVFMERKFTFLRCWFWYVSPDETAFLRWRLAALLARNRFVDIHITPFDWLHPATPRALMSLVCQLGRTFEATPGLREFAGSLYICGRAPG